MTRRYSQLVKRGSGDTDALKYKAVKMVGARKVVQGTPDTIVNYIPEIDFRIDPTDDNFQWI